MENIETTIEGIKGDFEKLAAAVEAMNAGFTVLLRGVDGFLVAVDENGQSARIAPPSDDALRAFVIGGAK